MNILIKLLVPLIIICATTNSYCQKNFSAASIITIEGDTVKGYIDYRNWGKNPTSIRFKKNLGEETTTYNSIQIAGFNVANERYQSAIVKLDKSTYKLGELSDSSGYNFGIDTTFLLTVIDGNKSLYYYKDKSGKENFFIKKGKDYEYLLNKNYLKKDDEGKLLIGVNENYLQQLFEYLGDCTSVNAILTRARYNQKDLTRIFKSYQVCSNNIATYQKKDDKNLSELGIVAGFAFTKLTFMGETFPFLSHIDYPMTKTPSFGLFYNLVLPRSLRRFSLYNEVLYTSYKVGGTYVETENENKSTQITTSLGYSYLKLNNLLRYRLPLPRAFIYVNAGISSGLAISETNYKKRESRFYTFTSVDEGKALTEPRKFEQGLVAGLGGRVKKYSLDLRYESGSGISDYYLLGSSTKRVYILLGYRF